jgi:hypothetical protein
LDASAPSSLLPTTRKLGWNPPSSNRPLPEMAGVRSCGSGVGILVVLGDRTPMAVRADYRKSSPSGEQVAKGPNRLTVGHPCNLPGELQMETYLADVRIKYVCPHCNIPVVISFMQSRFPIRRMGTAFRKKCDNRNCDKAQLRITSVTGKVEKRQHEYI